MDGVPGGSGYGEKVSPRVKAIELVAALVVGLSIAEADDAPDTGAALFAVNHDAGVADRFPGLVQYLPE